MATITTGSGSAGVITVSQTSTTSLSAALLHGKPCTFTITLTAGKTSDAVPIAGLHATDVAVLAPLNLAAAQLTTAYATISANTMTVSAGSTFVGTETFGVIIFPQPMNI